MSGEASTLWGGDPLAPEQIVADAVVAEAPVIYRYCLFSGGGDSTALAHRCRDLYDELAHLDTGTALPGVRDHVERVAALLDKPLRVFEAGPAYRELVLGGPAFWDAYRRHCLDHGEPPGGPMGYVAAMKAALPPRSQARKDAGLPDAPLGFPGPGGHGFPYVRLKERQIQRLVRETRRRHGLGVGRPGRVALLTGIRAAESSRRKLNAAKWGYWQRKDNRLMVNPIVDWTGDRLRAYRRAHDLPVSDVTALLHRSGECNCGAFANADERAEVRSLYPDWWAEQIEPLEAEARELGVWPDSWGHGRRDVARAVVGDGQLELCADCDLRAAAGSD